MGEVGDGGVGGDAGEGEAFGVGDGGGRLGAGGGAGADGGAAEVDVAFGGGRRGRDDGFPFVGDFGVEGDVDAGEDGG